MEKLDLFDKSELVNEMLARYGVKFGIYKNNTFREQLFPFDPIPRIIAKNEFDHIEKGLRQRVDALNCFLHDVYHDKEIIKDGIVHDDFVYSSKGYLPQCEGITPPKKIYAHIAGIDLVKGKDGHWYVLEDNLRIPSGASYPMIVRYICRRASPETFRQFSVEDNRDYATLLKGVMDEVNTGGINVILTPGRFNAAYFEHSFLAEQTGAHLANGNELMVIDDYLYIVDFSGQRTKVGTLYSRISDEYLDPLAFNPESLIGIPNIFEVYKKGNVAIVNTPGNGVGDDKGIYYFVPKMIKYYLNEEPILHNAPTYLPFFEQDYNYVVDHIDSLVLKDVAEAGGYGVVFGSKMSVEQRSTFLEVLKKDRRRFIAQEVIDFQDLEILEDDESVMRKADLRAFVLTSDETRVWKSGLTRFTRNPDSFIVNSSQGGGFKDTWILSH